MLDSIFLFFSQIDWVKYLMLIIAVFLAICYIVKKGLIIDLKNKRVSFSSSRTSRIRCNLCDEEIVSIVKGVAALSFDINGEGYKCREKLEDLLATEIENIDFRMGSFFTEILEEQLKRQNITDPRMKVILLKLNMQLLNLIWIIKKNEVFSLLRSSVIQNHYTNMEAIDLRNFSKSKFDLFMTKLEKSKIFPDFSDDINFIIDRDEFLFYLKERMLPIILDTTHNIYFQAQQIRQDSQKNINEISKKIDNCGEEFKKKRERIIQAIEK